MEGYFSFNGRIGRQTYWLAYCLPAVAIYAVAAMIDSTEAPYDGSYGVASLVAALACFAPSIAGGIKRCHDRDKSGWWLLLSIVPVLGGI